MHKILLCRSCWNYTLDEKCGCGGKPESVIPMKYSPDDKYAGYRRQALRKEREEKGLL